jgi:hypothetical protein
LKFQRLVVPLFLFVRSQTRIGFAHHDHFGWGMRWSSYGNICNATKLVQTCYLKRVLQLSGVCAGCFCLSAGWSLARFAESESLSCGVQCAWPSQGRSWTATWSVQYLSLHWLSKTLASQSGTSLLHTMGIADPWPGRGARRYQIAKAYTYHITSEYHDMIWNEMTLLYNINLYRILDTVTCNRWWGSDPGMFSLLIRSENHVQPGYMHGLICLSLCLMRLH